MCSSSAKRATAFAERGPDLVEDRRRWDRIAQMRGQEANNLARDLEIRNVGVEVDPIQTLQIQRHMSIEDIIHGHQLGHDPQRGPSSSVLTSPPPRRSEAEPHWVAGVVRSVRECDRLGWRFRWAVVFGGLGTGGGSAEPFGERPGPRVFGGEPSVRVLSLLFTRLPPIRGRFRAARARPAVRGSPRRPAAGNRRRRGQCRGPGLVARRVGGA